MGTHGHTHTPCDFSSWWQRLSSQQHSPDPSAMWRGTRLRRASLRHRSHPQKNPDSSSNRFTMGRGSSGLVHHSHGTIKESRHRSHPQKNPDSSSNRFTMGRGGSSLVHYSILVHHSHGTRRESRHRCRAQTRATPPASLKNNPRPFLKAFRLSRTTTRATCSPWTRPLVDDVDFFFRAIAFLTRNSNQTSNA